MTRLGYRHLKIYARGNIHTNSIEGFWSLVKRGISGVYHAVKSSATAEFYGSREYQYGDPLKHIHWRNTARRGRFMIKEFEQARQGSVSVAFEARRDFGVGRETTLEYSIKIAASLAKLCADSGRNIDIIAGKTPLHNAVWREAMDLPSVSRSGGKSYLGGTNGRNRPGPGRRGRSAHNRN